MSQDQPKQPKPSRPQTQRPKPQTAKPASSSPDPEELVQKATQTLQQGWERVQPVLKTQSIKALRFTIQTLEKTVKQLETQPTPSNQANLSTQTPGETLSGTSTPTPETGAAATPDGSPQTPLIPSSTLDAIKRQFQEIGSTLWSWWLPVLAVIRPRLPESLQKYSDRVLSAAIAGLFFVLFWLTSSVFSGDQPAQVATVPPSQRIPPADLVAPTDLKAPQEPEPIAISPLPAPVAPAPAPIPAPPPEPVVAPPIKPVPVELPPAEMPPMESAPPVVLTPEQKRIVELEAQVTEVTDHYAEGLTQAIKANFRGGRLTVKVSDRWYDLTPERQDQLAENLLDRAQALNFNKLEVTSPEGALVARSPVVGSQMVILKRQA